MTEAKRVWEWDRTHDFYIAKALGDGRIYRDMYSGFLARPEDRKWIRANSVHDMFSPTPS